ncbi:MAG TPA: VWD domain-containing protein, partial [Beutenbergiaceae bacterium]|nr:VWD domain-containing protein [Beutenbergiaceae bacterium]
MSPRFVAGLAAVFVLTSCSLSQPSSPTPPEAEETAQPAAAGETSDGPVQDTWVYERIQTVVDDRFINITEQVVGGLDTQDEAVDLPGGVSFYPLTDSAHIADLAGNEREDLDVVAGIAEHDDVAKLQVIATPRGDTSVGADDVVVVDLSFLDLPDDAPLIAEFAFGQGLPADGEDPDLDGADLLVDRMENDRFEWFGVDVEGEPTPGLLTTMGSVPSIAGTRDSSGEEGITRDALWREESSVIPVDDGDGGGIPAKARPTTDSLGEIGKCKSPSLKCISDYFKEMTKGFEESLDLLFNRNMPSPPPPTPPTCPPPCGGGHGEPHMVTFDQHAYDLQLVGEFVLAQSSDVAVQIRTAPAGNSDRVSIITGVAIEAFGERFTFEVGRDELILHDGAPVERPINVEAGEVEVYEHGGVAQVVTPEGVRVII